MHNTDPQQCRCLLSDLVLQHHAAPTETLLLPRCYISDLSSKSNHSPIRSVHIKPSPVETDPTDVLLGLPRGKPRNPVNRKQATCRHVSQIASESLSRAASDSSLPDCLLGPRAAQKAFSSTDLLRLRIWWSYDVARASTRHLGFRHLLHAPVALARAFHAPKPCC